MRFILLIYVAEGNTAYRLQAVTDFHTLIQNAIKTNVIRNDCQPVKSIFNLRSLFLQILFWRRPPFSVSLPRGRFRTTTSLQHPSYTTILILQQLPAFYCPNNTKSTSSSLWTVISCPCISLQPFLSVMSREKSLTKGVKFDRFFSGSNHSHI